MTLPFSRVLIANRGEIAVRIIKTCRKLGIHSIAVYSDADAGAMHVREADSAEYIGPSPAAESYLKIEAVLEAARKSNAEAIHPGYGFLSENADFAEACAGAGFVFVGPSPEAIRAMGDKVNARRLMAAAGVPVIPGYDGDDGRPEAISKALQEIGYPLMVKAAAGGGGRGMRVVRDPAELDEALESASREAQASFSDGRIFIEKLIEDGRHVEAQIFGDDTGRVVFLGERECSIQRRHQKVIEECPSPAVDEALRERLSEAAIKAGEAVSYTNAGTVEFLLALDNSFYFLEMNTRLQVEHPVTEEVLGIDLVEWQLRVAGGECLPTFRTPTGHAMEFRIYAEDPGRGFIPSPAIVDTLDIPATARWDSGYEAGDEIPAEYDALVGKLIVAGEDRDETLRAARTALGQLIIRGPATNLTLQRSLAAHRDVTSGSFDVAWLEQALSSSALSLEPPVEAVLAAIAWDLVPRGEPWLGAWRPVGGRGSAAYSLDGKHHDIWYASQRYGAWTVGYDDRVWQLEGIESDGTALTFHTESQRHYFQAEDRGQYILLSAGSNTHAVERIRISRSRLGQAQAGSAGQVVKAPMPGTVIKLLVVEGESVTSGQPVGVIEAMKMEHQLSAPADGVVDEIFVSEGQRVEEGEVILSLAAQEQRKDSGKSAG